MFSGTTTVLGIIGNPIDHSLSPFLHNLASVSLGEELMYAPFPVESDQLEQAVEGIRALNILGVNVTIPYKEAVIPFLDSVEEAARHIGAVNTIVRVEGRLHGANTDHLGFEQSLREIGAEPSKAPILILGAGGAARGVFYALGRMRAREIVLSARTVSRAEELRADLAPAFPETACRVIGTSDEELREAAATAGLIVNTTPVGMGDDSRSSLPEGVRFPEGCTVVDIIYDPARTPLLKSAEAAGCTVLNGFPMLVYQAWESLALWTGKRPTADLHPNRLLRLLPGGRSDEPTSSLPEASRRAAEERHASERPGFPLDWKALDEALQGRPIFLVGFMGAGKTTIGRELAACLRGRAFIDTDHLVEARAGMSIPDIFALLGEKAFREMEQDALFRAAETEHAVIALGGGAFATPTVHRACKKFGVVLWLHVPLEVIRERLQGDDSRPLWQHQERIEELYRFRQRFYEQAHLTIPAAGNVDSCVAEIRYRLADFVAGETGLRLEAWNNE